MSDKREIQTSKQRVSETLGAFPKIAEKEREGRYSDKMSDNPSTMLAKGAKGSRLSLMHCHFILKQC
jgi:hypothetical protein